MPSPTQDIMTWLFIIVSIALVAGITYVYTNRNRLITFLFSLFSIAIITFVKLVSVVEVDIHQNFLGSYDEENLPYMAAKPGWSLLIHAWHIWILPVALVIVIASVIIFAIWRYKKAGSPKLAIEPPTAALKTAYTPVKTQRLDTFMVVDAAKKESRVLQEKLAEALLTIAAHEIKISDLSTHVKALETELTETQSRLQEEIDTLQLELSAKNKENEYISNQLAERNRDLLRAQEMFEKLAALHRKIQSG
jgi:hypothetical protein